MNSVDEKKGKRVALSARKNTERERNGSNKKVCENGKEGKVVMREKEREKGSLQNEYL